MSDLVLLFDQHGILFLFLLIAVTDAGVPIPIPYDLVILLGGHRGLPLWQVVVAVVPGTVIGNSILYFLARTFGYKLLEKYERFFFLTHPTHERMEGWFLRFGPIVVVLARLVPGFRFAASFVSGLMRLPYKGAFLPSLVLASFLWAISYYYLGRVIGERVFYLLKFGYHFSPLSFTPITIILLIGFFVVFRIWVQKWRSPRPWRGGVSII